MPEPEDEIEGIIEADNLPGWSRLGRSDLRWRHSVMVVRSDDRFGSQAPDANLDSGAGITIRTKSHALATVRDDTAVANSTMDPDL